jgi:hypothetical protein
MRNLLLSLLLLFTFSGCQDKEQQEKHDAKVAQQARTELLAELEKEKKAQEAQNHRFSHMGVKMEQGTLSIDTNKTKDFLKDLGMRMHVQMKQVSDDLQKGVIDAQEAGVKINNGNINIDLNKTQTLLDEWSKKIDGYVKEFDEIAKEIEDNRTKEIH